jgi:hypothetical protein
MKRCLMTLWICGSERECGVGAGKEGCDAGMNKVNRLIVLIAGLFLLTLLAALAQDEPLPKSSNTLPLEITIESIRKLVNSQEPVNFNLTRSDMPGATFKEQDTFAVTESANCSLTVESTQRWTVDFGKGFNYQTARSANSTATDRLSLSSVKEVQVESARDFMNRVFAPRTAEYQPPIFITHIQTVTSGVQRHYSGSTDNSDPKIFDRSLDFLNLFFRDEETASRIAKAIQRAGELCSRRN